MTQSSVPDDDLAEWSTSEVRNSHKDTAYDKREFTFGWNQYIAEESAYKRSCLCMEANLMKKDTAKGNKSP